MNFEWDPDKNRTNIGKHGIDFENAKELFNQPTVEKVFACKGEERVLAYGYLQGLPLVVVYKQRGEMYRLISARLATRVEEQDLIHRLGMEQKRRDRGSRNLRQHKSKD